VAKTVNILKFFWAFWDFRPQMSQIFAIFCK